jgi:hypothetical protein
MKYTIQTSKYIFKNFFYVVLFAVIPAFALSLSLAEEEIVNVLNAVRLGDFSKWTFSDLFSAISVLNFSDWHSILSGIVGLILLVPCVALLMAFLDKHLRFGKRTFNGLWSKLNDNFISTFGYTFLFVAIYEVWALLLSALLIFVALIPNAIAVYILAGIIFIAMHVALLYAIGAIYLWLPCMQITGFRAIEALQYSHQLMTTVKWRILVGQLLFLFATEALLVACVWFFPDIVIFTILTTVLFTILLLIYCVRMVIAYFDRDHIERADLRTYY